MNNILNSVKDFKTKYVNREYEIAEAKYQISQQSV